LNHLTVPSTASDIIFSLVLLINIGVT